MADITAIILTKNEEKNIADCINSIKDVVQRVVVVDSGSTDGTVSIASSLGAEILCHPFENYSKQFLYALDTIDCKTRWILRIDADEQLSPKAAVELERVCNENMSTDVNGIVLRFEVTFMGKKLRHGGIYPFKKLLCFKNGMGTIEKRNMDEHIVLFEGRSVEIKEDCYHHDYKDLTFWIGKHNSYSSREALDFFERENEEINNIKGLAKAARIKRFIKFRIYYRLPMGVRAKLYFWYRYYILLGFLDGKEGRIFAFLQAYWYRFLVDAKIYEEQKKQG